ncbi:MAG: GNAT family N-acetyltransferase, partial [Planctomycetia bacterium]
MYFKRFRMEIDLANLPEVPELPPGFSWVAWNDAVVDHHAEVKYRCFVDELDATIFPCLGDHDGCRRLMRDIANRRGFLPAATWLVAN